MHTTILVAITWHGVLLWAVVFVVTFVVSLAIVSFILVRIPPDYFQKKRQGKILPGKNPVLRYLAVIGKNLLGGILVVLGVIMSIPGVPGQGILTILLGIMLLDFPGKRRLEHKIVSRPHVRNTINKLRKKFGKPQLELD